MNKLPIVQPAIYYKANCQSDSLERICNFQHIYGANFGCNTLIFLEWVAQLEIKYLTLALPVVLHGMGKSMFVDKNTHLFYF